MPRARATVRPKFTATRTGFRYSRPTNPENKRPRVRKYDNKSYIELQELRQKEVWLYTDIRKHEISIEKLQRELAELNAEHSKVTIKIRHKEDALEREMKNYPINPRDIVRRDY